MQGLEGGVDQVDTDSEGMVHAADMLFAQPANVLCQPTLIKSAYLLQ